MQHKRRFATPQAYPVTITVIVRIKVGNSFSEVPPQLISHIWSQGCDYDGRDDSAGSGQGVGESKEDAGEGSDEVRVRDEVATAHGQLQSGEAEGQDNQLSDGVGEERQQGQEDGRREES